MTEDENSENWNEHIELESFENSFTDDDDDDDGGGSKSDSGIGGWSVFAIEENKDSLSHIDVQVILLTLIQLICLRRFYLFACLKCQQHKANTEVLS